jgi:excisionase family DNA binding protein
MDKYLTTDEVAKTLGVSVPTLKRWRRIGYGCPHVKAGHKVLYKVSDLTSWLDSTKRQSIGEVQP